MQGMLKIAIISTSDPNQLTGLAYFAYGLPVKHTMLMAISTDLDKAHENDG